MALESAVLLDQKLFASSGSSGSNYQDDLLAYQAEINHWHCSWSDLIEYFYDGRMLAMGQQRDAIRSGKRFSLSRVAEPIISRSLAQMVGGVATRSRFNQRALYHSCRHLVDNDSLLEKLAIRGGEAAQLKRAA